MLAGGHTTVEAVFDPLLHVYDPAPSADNVEQPPAHIDAGFATAEITGNETTVIAITVDELHEPSSPVTVYWVLAVGVTTAGLVVKPPGYQV